VNRTLGTELIWKRSETPKRTAQP